jgi:hypothetical protein
MEELSSQVRKALAGSLVWAPEGRRIPMAIGRFSLGQGILP